MKTLAESSFRNEQYQQAAGTAIVGHIFVENFSQTSNMMQSTFSFGISRLSHDFDDDYVETFPINSNEISRCSK